MSAINVVVAAAVSFIVLLLGKVSLDLISKELQGQAEQLPHRILRLAARQLPPVLRTQYFEDWEAELDHILKRHDARPITRLLLGFRFVTSLLRGARQVRADYMRSLPRGKWSPGQKKLADGNTMLMYEQFRPLTGDIMWRAECTDGWVGQESADYKDVEYEFGDHLSKYHGRSRASAVRRFWGRIRWRRST